MELLEIENEFSICKIENTEQADLSREFAFLHKTPDEMSLVCETDHIPSDVTVYEPGWRALKVSGILEFSMIGVIAKIAEILAKAEISIFVISTYNTDYIFLKTENYNRGVQELMHNGYVVK